VQGFQYPVKLYTDHQVLLECLQSGDMTGRLARWLVQGFQYPVKLYTDHQVLLECLQSGDMTGRLARWQLTLSEYNLDITHVPSKELATR